MEQQDICPDAGDMAAFLSNTLPGIQQQRFESHLERCEPCRDAAANLQTILEEPMQPVPAHIIDRAKGLRPLSLVKRRPSRLSQCAAAAAVVVLGGGLGFYMGVRSAIGASRATPSAALSTVFGAMGSTPKPDSGSQPDGGVR